jgi:predicted Fe-Mo cluster-binding NifX family protein
MKVAMPTFGNRVSPRFDCANSFLIVTVHAQEILERRELDATHWTPNERVARIIAMGVDAVVCGGIDRYSAESLRDAGITLYGSFAGASEETLQALMRGRLSAERPPAGPTAREDAVPKQAVSSRGDVASR